VGIFLRFIFITNFLFLSNLEISFGNTSFYVADKAESCFPDFLGVGGPATFPDKETSDAEYLQILTDYHRPCQLVEPISTTMFLSTNECLNRSPFRKLKSFVPNSSGSHCALGKACYCKLSTSEHLLPLKCIPAVAIETYETCDFSESQNSLAFKNSGCSEGGVCYRVPFDTDAISNIRNLFKNEETGNYSVTTQQLTTLSINSGGICLPNHSCKAQKVGHNMVMKSQDECAFGATAVEEIDGENVCINPAYKSEVIVPDSIEFHLDNNNCSIFAVEMFDGEKSEDPLYQNLFLPLPEGKLRISPALIKYANFERYLSSLQWLWGTASSKNVTNPRSQVHKRIKLGKYAKKALEKFDTNHRYIYALKAYELNQIKKDIEEALTNEDAQEGGDTDPLIGLRAQIDASKKIKNILPLEIKNYRQLLGGSSYISELASSDGSKSEGSFFNDYNDQSTYKNSLAYLKDASSSLSASMWERRKKNAKSCQSRWAIFPDRSIGCRKLNGGTKDCRPIPGFLEALFDIEWLGVLLHLATAGTLTIFSAVTDGIIGLFTAENPKLVNIKLCIDESIVVEGSVSDSNTNLNGKLINPIYPNSLLSGAENVSIQSNNINSFGKKVSVGSKETFKDLIRQKYSNFINSPLPKFSTDEKNKLIPFIEGEYILNGSLPSPDTINGYIDGGDLSGLKRQKISMTALEYTFYQKSFADPENLGIYVDKTELEDLKKEHVDHAEVIKDETLNLMSETIYEHFIRMHFTRKQNQYHTSEVVGGAGFYNFNVAYGDHGETLGYMKELYSMAEYIYKYQLALDQGYSLQISCLEEKLSDLDGAITGGGSLSNSSGGTGPVASDVFYEFTEGLESEGFSSKELKQIDKKFKKPIKPQMNKTNTNSIDSDVSSGDKTQPGTGNKNASSNKTSRLKKDKKLAKNLSTHRKNKIKRLKKINKSNKAQLSSTDDILKDVLGPVISREKFSAQSKLKSGKSISSKNAKQKNVIKKESKDPFLVSKVNPSDDKEFQKTKYRISRKNRRKRKNNTGGSTGLSTNDKRKILKNLKSGKRNFQNTNDDTLFERVSRTYIRAAYPVLLKLK